MRTDQASVKLSAEATESHLVSVKLRVYYKGDKRRYAFPLKEPILVTAEDFKRLLKFHKKDTKGRTAEDVQTLYDKLSPSILKAELLAQTLMPFSYAGFKQAFYSDKAVGSPGASVVALLDAKAAKLEASDRISNAYNYRSAARSFERFVTSFPDPDRVTLLGGSPTLLLSHITPEFLAKYERWMLQSGKAPRAPGGPATPAGLTTVSIYCRNLRSVYNEAIDADLIDESSYPFKKKGYVIPASTNTKKALSKEDVLRIIAYQAEPGTAEQRSKDLWVFSYLSNGMNLADICRLRWKDIDLTEKTLTFIRQKTTQTRKAKQVKITCTLFPESLAIVERWGSNRKGLTDYAFPFIEDSMDARRQRASTLQLIKRTNFYMSRIAEKLGIQSEVNTYSARHSFATILLRSEAPVAFISQSLGHTSLKTTEDYLGSFEDEQTKKYLSNLL